MAAFARALLALGCGLCALQAAALQPADEASQFPGLNGLGGAQLAAQNPGFLSEAFGSAVKKGLREALTPALSKMKGMQDQLAAAKPKRRPGFLSEAFGSTVKKGLREVLEPVMSNLKGAQEKLAAAMSQASAQLQLPDDVKFINHADGKGWISGIVGSKPSPNGTSFVAAQHSGEYRGKKGVASIVAGTVGKEGQGLLRSVGTAYAEGASPVYFNVEAKLPKLTQSGANLARSTRKWMRNGRATVKKAGNLVQDFQEQQGELSELARKFAAQTPASQQDLERASGAAQHFLKELGELVGLARNLLPQGRKPTEKSQNWMANNEAALKKVAELVGSYQKQSGKLKGALEGKE